MRLPMLVVDSNIDVSQREQIEWMKHGISTVRVNTMKEAIEKIAAEPFLFIAINADNVNYMPLLKVMRDTTPTIIFIIGTKYSTEKEVEALHNGADVFTKFNPNVELNVQLALAQLLRCNERNRPLSKLSGVMIYEKFLLLSDLRRIFYNDNRLVLTKKEYDILHYLIENHDIPLTYNQIYSKVWGRDYDNSCHKSLWDYILKVRKKLQEVTGGKEYIMTERDIGYRFSSITDI